MATQIWYHNVTKGMWNVSSAQDIIDEMDSDDDIKFSEAGNALVFDMKEEGPLETKGQYDQVRIDFADWIRHDNHQRYLNTFLWEDGPKIKPYTVKD